MLSHSTCGERIAPVGGVHACSVDVNLGLHGGVYGSHHNLRHELFARIQRCLLRYDECVEFVHADILDVNVSHESVQHLALGIAYVALQLREQRHGCSHRHVLEHVLLPVLSHCHGVLRQFCREVAAYYLLLLLVGHHGQDFRAVGIDGVIERLSLACSRREHHLVCRLEVFLVFYVLHISVLAVSLAHYSLLQLLRKVVQRVAHLLHGSSLLEPLSHLLGVFLHLLLEAVVHGCVLLAGVCGGSVETFLNEREPLQHFRGDVERKHCHEDDVHEVDHLLARRYWSFLYCHFLLRQVLT